MRSTTTIFAALLFSISVTLAANLVHAQQTGAPPAQKGTVTAGQDESRHVAPQAVELGAQPGSRQTAQQIEQTLRSLRKVDDHPLYVMTYYGDYDVDAGTSITDSCVPAGGSWGCSLFASLGDRSNAVFGRNFDWFHHPALLLFSDPSDGFASVSMVDISYLGFDRQDLTPLDSLAGRRPLLQAPFLPFDGMNECGLTVGMAAVGDTDVPSDPSKPTVHSVGLIRLMLDRAKTVDQALEIASQYNVDFVGGPNIHYLIADKDGSSAVVEIKDGQTHVIRGSGTWQSATNFYLTGNLETACEQCARYSRIHARLNELEGKADPAQAMQLLQMVAQANTQWSVVYRMHAREVHIAMDRRFQAAHQFQLEPTGAD